MVGLTMKLAVSNDWSLALAFAYSLREQPKYPSDTCTFRIRPYFGQVSSVERKFFSY